MKASGHLALGSSLWERTARHRVRLPPFPSQAARNLLAKANGISPSAVPQKGELPSGKQSLSPSLHRPLGSYEWWWRLASASYTAAKKNCQVWSATHCYLACAAGMMRGALLEPFCGWCPRGLPRSLIWMQQPCFYLLRSFPTQSLFWRKHQWIQWLDSY